MLLQLLLNRSEIISEGKTDVKKFIKHIAWTDLEDGLQMQCSANYDLGYIIIRNIKDFEHSSVPAIMPADFLKL